MPCSPPQGTMLSCSPPGIPHWDPGIHSAQVRSGWAEGCARTSYLAVPALPTCQLPALRLTCLLPDCQLSHWDLSGHPRLVPFSGNGREWRKSCRGVGLLACKCRIREPRRRGR